MSSRKKLARFAAGRPSHSAGDQKREVQIFPRHNWRYLPHMKDEALSPVAFRMEKLPLAEPTAPVGAAAEKAVRRLIEITASQQQTRRTLLYWLRVGYGIEKPSNKLPAVIELDPDAWV